MGKIVPRKFKISKAGPAGMLGAAKLIDRQGSGRNNAAAYAFAARGSGGGAGGGGGAPPTPPIPPTPPVDPPEVILNAVEFDGVNDYLNRGADLTGIADSKVGTVSFWLKIQTAATGLGIMTNDFSRFRISLATGGIIKIVGLDSVAATALTLDSLTSYDNTSGWVHVLASWDLANAKGSLYINDVDDLNTGTDIINDLDIEHTGGANFFVGSASAGVSKLDGCLAQVYFNPNEYIDLSVESNRRKFISANGLSVDMGSDGSLPTGTQPIVFLNGDTVSWHTNKGSGGGFTEVGALTTCGSVPGPFAVNAVHFDGTNDYLRLNVGFTGQSSSALAMWSFWVNPASSGTTRMISEGFDGGNPQPFEVGLNTDNKLDVKLRDSIGTLLVLWTSSATVTTGWTHVLIGVSLGATPVFKVYLGDVADAGTFAVGPVTGSIKFNAISEAAVGARPNGANKFDGDVAEFYWNDDEYLDPDTEANRRKFIDADGKPVDLGADGSTPTSTAAIVFLSGDTDAWHTNKGTGGGFTENGALTDAATSPSD